MKSISKATSLISAIIVGLISIAHAQNQTPLKNSKMGPSVSGRVTLKGKGTLGVVVTLRRPDASSPFEIFPRAITDQEGNYRISGVTPGDYLVTASAPSFVSANSDGLSRRIVITEDENVENINFVLVKGGVITGKITDADTRPVIQTAVRLYRMPELPPNNQANATQPAPTIYPAGTQMTDDRGIYRFFGLTAGKYAVAVGRDDQGFSMVSRTPYKEVFYPDVTDRTKATLLEVKDGGEIKDIDIALGRPIETFNVSGRVVGENGQGLPFIRLSFQKLIDDRGTFTNALASTNAQGEFLAENLIPGKYLAYPFQEPNSELRPESSSFEIIDADVTGLTIRMVKGASVSGNVVLDTEDKRAYEKLSKLLVQVFVQNLTPASGNPSGSSARGTIGPDGSFRVAGLGPGMAYIQLVPTDGLNEMKGFGVSSITRDGTPVTPRSLELKENDQVTGIRISVVFGSATLRGLVSIQNGSLSPGQHISVRVVRGVDQQYANVRPPTVDSRGRFIVEGISPGSYELWVTVTGVKKPTVKQTVVLQDGVTTDVTIPFDVSDQTSP